MLEVSEPGSLYYYTLFCLFLLTLFASRSLTLIHLSLSGSLDSLRCYLIAPTPSLAFFFPIPHPLTAGSSFSSGRAYPFLNFLPPLSVRLIPTLITVEVIISLHKSSLLFLNVYAPPIRSFTDTGTNSFSPLIFFLLPEMSSLWGLLLRSPPQRLKRY